MNELDEKFSEAITKIRQQAHARGYASMEDLYGIISGMLEVASSEMQIPSSTAKCHMMMWMIKDLVIKNNEPELHGLLLHLQAWSAAERSLALH